MKKSGTLYSMVDQRDSNHWRKTGWSSATAGRGVMAARRPARARSHGAPRRELSLVQHIRAGIRGSSEPVQTKCKPGLRGCKGVFGFGGGVRGPGRGGLYLAAKGEVPATTA